MATDAKSIPLVYFLTAEAPKYPIKVGRTTIGGFKGRMAQIQTGMPYPLKVLFALQASPEAEAEVHYIYQDWRLRGEWFKPCKSLLVCIEELQRCHPDWRTRAFLHPREYTRRVDAIIDAFEDSLPV